MKKPKDWKDTNPKAAFAANKVPLELWPAAATYLGAMGLLEGACKYGRANWRKSGVRASTYVGALGRHLAAYMEGEDLDPDSGLPQMAHVLACAAILTDADMTGRLVDDRQYRGHKFKEFAAALTAMVPLVRGKHTAKNPIHYDKRIEAEEDARSGKRIKRSPNRRSKRHASQKDQRQRVGSVSSARKGSRSK